MEKLLLIGIDTRSMLNSALKLDYDVYSTSYFSTSDTPIIKNQKIILKESDGESCGEFENQFDAKQLLDISKDYIDEVNYIIPISGISARKAIASSTLSTSISLSKYRIYKFIE